jgi:L-iditol 2-dehydrogenase
MGTDNYAAVLHGAHDLRIEDRPVPEPGPHQVLVDVSAVGVCGSDVHYYQHGRIGKFIVDHPMILGHEASGVIVGQGTDATRHPIGTRVALEPGVPCRRCIYCRTGSYNLCPDVEFFATPPFDGAFANYVVIDEDFAYPVPDNVSDEAAAMIEPLSVGMWATSRAGVHPGDEVLVTGAGPIGMLCAAAAALAGAQSVTVADINPRRLRLATKFGATAVHDSSTGAYPGGADVLLECSGNPRATGDALAALRPAGRAVLVGMGADTLAVPLQMVQNRELTITGTFRYANTYPQAIAAVASGHIDLDLLVGARYALEQAEDALQANQVDDSLLKVVVRP